MLLTMEEADLLDKYCIKADGCKAHQLKFVYEGKMPKSDKKALLDYDKMIMYMYRTCGPDNTREFIALLKEKGDDGVLKMYPRLIEHRGIVNIEDLKKAPVK